MRTEDSVRLLLPTETPHVPYVQAWIKMQFLLAHPVKVHKVSVTGNHVHTVHRERNWSSDHFGLAS